MKNIFKVLVLLVGMTVPILAGDKPAVPDKLDLKPGFKPEERQLSEQRGFGFPGARGCDIGPVNGLRPFYITQFQKGMLRGEPLAVGDVILAIDGAPMAADPIGALRRKFSAAREKAAKVTLTRWRDGSITNVTVNSISDIPDFTLGDKHEDSHDWTLGPTGMRGWIYSANGQSKDARQILVTEVAKGSPADGIMSPDDVILGVGGKLFDGDARIQYAGAIAAAEQEQAGGMLKLVRWRGGKTENVELKLSVLGKYSDIAPYDCVKSRKIFEQGCAAIAKRWSDPHLNEDNLVFGPLNALALLASGKEEYRPQLAAYAKKVAEYKAEGFVTWHYGYINMFLAEYVMATGDKSVLPGVKRLALAAAHGQSAVGTWGHKFARPDGNCNGYGCMNQPGLTLMISMVLARQAGVDDPALDRAIEKGSKFLRWYVNKGAIPYGDHGPWQGHEDNGKCSSAAVLFDLLGDSEAAAFFARMSTAAYDERERGHTGNFFNELWAMPAVSRCGPLATGAYLKEQSWYFDLARKWDGSFAYQGSPLGEEEHRKYTAWDSTGAYLLAYALPLKSLYITGKKPSCAAALKPDEVADVIAAGRDYFPVNGKSAYDARPTEILMAGLSSWSPAMRLRSAKSLAKRDGDFVPALLKLLEGSDRYGRYGAVEMLGLLGPRAAGAAPQLRAALFDADPWVQSLACSAIPSLGTNVAPECVKDLLRMVVTNNPADPRRIAQRSAALALFSPLPGGNPAKFLVSDALAGADRSLALQAIRALLQNDDAWSRGHVTRIYSRLTSADIGALLPDVVPTIERMAPSDEMFADEVRLAGLDLLSRLHISEGMDLCVSTIEDRWGNDKQKRLEYLKRYGVHARKVLPQLMQKRPEKRDEKTMQIFDKVISEIETTTNAPALVSLKEFAANSAAGEGTATNAVKSKP